MTAKISILAVTTGLILGLGIGGTAQARNARGASIVNTNSMDPTHRHQYEKGVRVELPADLYSGGKIKKIKILECRDCDSERRYIRKGVLDPKTYHVPSR